MNFMVGGRWHYSMTGPEGEQHFGRIDYLEIEPRRRFTGNDVFADASGATNESLPQQVLEATLSDQGDRTKLVIVSKFGRLEDMEKIIEMGFEQGFATAQDQLEALLTRT